MSRDIVPEGVGPARVPAHLLPDHGSCGSPGGQGRRGITVMSLTSTAWNDGGMIPVKYSQAGHASVLISREQQSITCIVRDDGVGFDTTLKANGIGLKNIRSRVDFYSGTMNIISAPGKGCVISINLPLQIKI